LANRPNTFAVAVLTLAMGALVFAASATNAAAQETPATLSFSPPPAALTAGEQQTYVLGIAGAQRLFGADIEIAFDPAVASVVDGDPGKEGTQVEILPFVDAGFVVYNVADNTKGTIRVTYTQLAPKPPAEGDGALVSFVLKASKGGDPRVRVSAALLARDDGTPQPVVLPSTGASPVPPSASATPRPSDTPPSAQPTTATAVVSDTPPATLTTPVAAATPAPLDAGGDSSTNATLALVVAGMVAAVAIATVVGRRYLKRNGETK